MMARGHATLGALGSSVVAFWPLHLDPLNSLIFIAAGAGFSLVPDLDEPKSTISQQFGPISKAVSGFTRYMAGGHRKATHTWPMILVMGGLGWLSTLYLPVGGFLLATAFILGIRTVMPDYISLMQAKVLPGALLMGGIIGISGVLDPRVLLVAPPLGILLHSLGDWPTPMGIPWFWPMRRTYSLNWFRAGDEREYGAIIPIMLFLLLLVMAVTLVPATASWFNEHGDPFQFLKDYRGVMRY